MVGLGPGGSAHLTEAARHALMAAEIVVGYRTYLDLVPPALLAGKEVISSEMTKEVDRCRRVWELAEAGRRVALVSGGDPGIYAMAGLIFEMGRERQAAGAGLGNRDAEAGLGKHEAGPAVRIEVVPGIAALNACAARLGAPLMHDFAVISLSDLLTPWEVIEKRLAAAAAADFVIVLYNPRSKRRTSQIQRAREIILAHHGPETPAGIVTAASRDNEKVVIATLGALPEEEINMQSCVIIGNSHTFVWENFMVTPRGYAGKYTLDAGNNGA